LPDTIVLDLEMPVMTGQELISVLHRYLRLATVPVVIVTGAEQPLKEASPMIVGYVSHDTTPWTEAVQAVCVAMTALALAAGAATTGRPARCRRV
jgi:CheY-like chemotaxis protein